MPNPFDDENLTFVVLADGEGRYSLWPESIGVPAGWRVVHGPAQRAECLGFVRANWTDMRPPAVRRRATAP
ncbi:MbtH family protein [Actinomadura sediminis]|uniref:MbtH family protein n=1 Tax=Actinomadura sediminis TaxID=1038904 RepID=A0ABW3EJ24_9ACTN